MDRFDIHNRQRRLELAINSVKSMPASQNNKEAILSFCNYCSAEGLSIDRIEHYARILKKISELFAKDFIDAEKQDIVELLLKIESRKLSFWTKHDYRVALKKFYRWLRNATEYPEEVVWIKTGFPHFFSPISPISHFPFPNSG
jgi:hypothetical protein